MISVGGGAPIPAILGCQSMLIEVRERSSKKFFLDLPSF